MPRSRLAVALVVPEPHRTEIDGLRRALGGDLHRIEPHITVVPPVNVRDEALPDALATVRSAAAELAGPLVLDLGPGDTFMPVNRVVHLAVGGDPAALDALVRLRAAANVGVLERPDHRAFVPHVTLSNRIDPDDVPAALTSLASYRVEATFEAVDLLSYDVEERRWSTMAAVALGPRRVVGRGGVELEIAASHVLDPEAAAFVARVAPQGTPVTDLPGRALLVVARRDGGVVGVARGVVAGATAWFDGLVVDPSQRHEGIGSQLLAAFGDDAARAGAEQVVAARPPDEQTAALLAARGWVALEPDALLVARGPGRLRRLWRP